MIGEIAARSNLSRSGDQGSNDAVRPVTSRSGFLPMQVKQHSWPMPTMSRLWHNIGARLATLHQVLSVWPTNDGMACEKPDSKETRTEIQPIGHQQDGYEKHSRAK